MADNAPMEWDELNLIRESVPSLVTRYQLQKNRKEAERWCDWLEFVLCLIYAYGWQDAEKVVGTVRKPDGIDDKAVNLEIKGETFRERVFAQLESASVDGILRIIDTEAHRDYNTGVVNAGQESGVSGIKKRWNTMLDDRVRDPHQWLEGVTVGLEDYFYADTGDYALFPGGFGNPELDCNCRCYVTLSL